MELLITKFVLILVEGIYSVILNLIQVLDLVIYRIILRLSNCTVKVEKELLSKQEITASKKSQD